MKRILILIVLLGLGVTMTAQNRWSGFLTPMTATRKAAMYKEYTMAKGVGDFFDQCKWRPTMGVSGVAVLPQFDEDWKFTGFDFKAFSVVGVGLSFEHFAPVENDTVMYVNYSIDLTVTLAATEDTNAGAFLGVSALNIWNLKPSFGVGVNFLKGVPFKALWYGGANLRYAF